MEKMIQLVRSMSRHDEKAFLRYLDSPFFRISPGVGSLFRSLLKNPARQEGGKRAGYLSSELTGHLEHFFTLRYLQQQPFEGQLACLRSLADRNCEKSWHYSWLQLKETETPRDASYHLSLGVAGEIAIGFLADKQSRSKEADYPELFTHLDAYYCSKKLQFCCEVINRKSLLSAATELPFLDDLVKQSGRLLHIPAVSMYYHILQMLTHPDDESNFSRVMETTLAHGHLFHARELSSCYAYLKNYCIRRMNTGDQRYAAVLFGIYKSYLSSPELIRTGYLSQFEFKNIVSLSLRLKEYDWCRDFIRKYSYHLAPGEKQNAVTYNTAYFHFMKGNFRQAIRMLREVTFSDVVYQLDARVILLKSYYELNDQDAFFYHASAFRLFLLRNRYISDFQKNLNRNLIRYLTRMIRDQYSGVKVTRLKSEIANAKDVADIRWLQEKAAQL
jgi:hypothetical protein